MKVSHSEVEREASNIEGDLFVIVVMPLSLGVAAVAVPRAAVADPHTGIRSI
jgi:hypothetical protein